MCTNADGRLGEMTDHADRGYIAPATQDDVPELAALARDQLPSMTGLHTKKSWRDFNRFGSGQQVRGNCTMLLRDGDENGPLIGFIWADDAMRIDYDIVEPWWCVNALAIAPQYTREGRGAALVAEVVAAAKLAGVVQLYGQTVPAAVPFWKHLGFTIAGHGEALRTYNQARHATGAPIGINAEPGPDDRWFVRYLTDAPGSVNSLLFPASLLPAD